MTEVNFNYCEDDLTIETIEAVEAQLGCTLPEEYREFLLVHNGGTPDPKCFDFREEGDAWIDFFYSIDEYLAEPNEDADGESIAFAHCEYADDVPNDCLIIGKFWRDDLVLLRLRGKRRGQIDLKLVDNSGAGEEENVHPIAESFSALLALLHK